MHGNTIQRGQGAVLDSMASGATLDQVVEIVVHSGESSFGGSSADVELGEVTGYKGHLSSGEEAPIAIELKRRKNVLGHYFFIEINL